MHHFENSLSLLKLCIRFFLLQVQLLGVPSGTGLGVRAEEARELAAVEDAVVHRPGRGRLAAGRAATRPAVSGQRVDEEPRLLGVHAPTPAIESMNSRRCCCT